MSDKSKTSTSIVEDLLDNMDTLKDKNIVFVLKPAQINILGQVFRPIFSGNIAEVTESFIILENVNMKIPMAPEFIFPKSLVIPTSMIAVFFEFDADKRFPLH